VAATPGGAGAQQAGFGTELFKREAWTVRLDASADPAGTTVAQAGGALTVSSEAGALVWRPRDRGTGSFIVRATVRVPADADAGAGLFFGGFDLEGMDRNWAACLVRPDGTWSIAHRNGVELHDFRPWAPSETVRPASAGEGSANLVEWVVGPERVGCRINGTEVYSFERARGVVPGGLRTIEGDVGIRVGAGVTATFDDFEIVPIP
jgi:hypothetical protein